MCGEKKNTIPEYTPTGMNKLCYIHKREYDSLMKMHRLLQLGAIWLKYAYINKRRMTIYIYLMTLLI